MQRILCLWAGAGEIQTNPQATGQQAIHPNTHLYDLLLMLGENVDEPVALPHSLEQVFVHLNRGLRVGRGYYETKGLLIVACGNHEPVKQKVRSANKLRGQRARNQRG